MRPLASLEPQRCRSLRGVVFDIDDTVTRDGRLEVVALDAMWRLRRAGVTSVCVTGRPLGWIDVLTRLWPVDGGVGENGAGWVWPKGSGWMEGYFEPPDVRHRQAGLLGAVRERVAAEMPDIREAGDQRARRCDLAFDIGESVTLPPDRIDALVALIEAEGARSSVSSVHAHAVPGSWDKAQGAARLIREAIGIDLEEDRERWVFVGDSGNDAAAFSFFPISVGVSNVRAHLARIPHPPRFVTESDRGVGFAEVVHHILEHR